MAYWQLGEKYEARQWYGKAIEWMRDHSLDEECEQCRDEMAEPLDIDS